MRTPLSPSVVAALLFGSGILLIIVGIPLMLRKVPPNWAYGVCIKATMHDEAVWYAVNARAGRDLVIVGGVYLAALILAHTVFQAMPLAVRVLVPVALLSVGLIVAVVRSLSAANGMVAEQRAADVAVRQVTEP